MQCEDLILKGTVRSGIQLALSILSLYAAAQACLQQTICRVTHLSHRWSITVQSSCCNTLVLGLVAMTVIQVFFN
eukprot:scaffold4689_cov142-Skeletonema_dohrnii-CCMP3373.AAC.5